MLFSNYFWRVTVLLMVYSVGGRAQTKCVIVDKETGTPIRNVKFYADNGITAVTDYRGVLLVDSFFKSATLSHVSYLSRVVNRSELRDTIWMLPKENRLSEVVVWGTERNGIKSMVAGAVADAPLYAPPKGVVTFDFFEMLRKKPLNKKARKKNQQLLRDWDKLYGPPPTSDPKNTP